MKKFTRRRVTKNECRFAWALALGLGVLPIAGRACAASKYGEWDDSKNAYIVEVTSGESYSSVYGYDTGMSTISTNATTTIGIVNIYDGEVTSTVVGGRSTSGNAEYNSVNILGGTVKAVTGGYSTSDNGTACANSVVISGGTITSAVRGNRVDSGTATGNYIDSSGNLVNQIAVEVTGGTLQSTLYGGYATSGTAVSNTVNVTGSDASDDIEIGMICGGYSGNGTAENNEVNMNGYVTVTGYKDSNKASHDGDVMGGWVTTSGEATGNRVTLNAYIDSEGNVLSPTVVEGLVYGGRIESNTDGVTASGNATNNTVTISAGTVGAGTSNTGKADPAIYGGYTDSGNASYNKVVLGTESADSTCTVTIKGHVYGGYTKSGDVIGNSVEILSGVNLTGSVYAGRTKEGNAQANSVTLAGESIVQGTGIGDLYGNYSDSSSSYYYASGIGSDGEPVTTVTVTGGEANTITAGYSLGGTAYANSVYISGGTINNTVRGNRTSTGTATGNYTDSSGNTKNQIAVTMTGGTVGTLYGGYADSSGTAVANAVEIYGGTISKSIYGGYSYSGTAAGNSVTVQSTTTDGTEITIGGDVYGNYSISGNAYGYYTDDNSDIVTIMSVIISGGTVSGSVYGGYSYSGTAAGNSVWLNNVTVSGDVYGGYSYSGTTTGNSISMCGNVTVSGIVYGGSSESGALTSGDYNTLWVAGKENYAETLKNFDCIKFDISDRENDDVMLTLKSDSVVDLTSVTSIGVDEDNSKIASVLGETLYLVVTENGIKVAETSISQVSGTANYTLSENSNSDDETFVLSGSGASLAGNYNRQIQVVWTSTDDDNNLTVVSEVESDEEGYLSGDALVLRIGDTIYVTDVDFNLASETQSENTLEWGTSLIALEEAKYDFSSTVVEDIGALTVTGDAVSYTLIADSDVSILLDGIGAKSVTDISLVSLDDLQDISITYTPADGVTVEGTAYVATGTSTDGNTTADSLVLVSDSIDSITFGAIKYVSPDDGALITLDGTSTYNMKETDIDVSDLTLVDNGGSITPTVNDEDVKEIVMTLVASKGSVTNLGQNDDVNEGADISEKQTFGYQLIGTDSEGNATGSTLTGTLTGYVISEDTSNTNSDSDESLESATEISMLSVSTASVEISEETDSDSAEDTYDLVLRTGTVVTVSSVTIDVSELSAGDFNNDDADAQLTLSELTYDFTSMSYDDITIGSTTEITGADTLLDVGSSLTLIDGSNAEIVNGMGVLAGYTSEYSYSIGDSIDVTGTGETAISSDGKMLTYDISNILTLDFWIDEGTSTDVPMLEVETADLSGTDVTAHAKDGDYLEPGYEVVLIEATEEGGLTTDDDTTYTGVVYGGVSVEYDLEVTKENDTIVARIIGEGKLRDETESLSQTRLVQTALIDAGVDQLLLAFDDAFMSVREKTKWTPYVAMSLGDFEFSTGHGGKIDIDSFNATVGLLRNYFRDDGVFSWGPVFQYGHADYDSAIGSVTASGDAEHVGGGLFARRRWTNGTYIEGAVTGGYSESDYASDTLLDGEQASFSVGAPYWSVYAGFARDYTNSHNRTVKPYVRYYYSHLNDATARLSTGELYDFNAVGSSRLRAGFRVTWDLNVDEPEKKDTEFAYLGAAYQYQFDGASVGIYRSMATHEPSLKGGSGIVEGGLRFSPKDSSMAVDVGVAGWFGAQQGVEGILKVKWDL